MAAQLAVDVPFAEREHAVLTAANEMCRRLLESTLQATAAAHPDRGVVGGALVTRRYATTGGPEACQSFCPST